MNKSAIAIRLTGFLAFCYFIFVIACTFSIALAQTTLGLAGMAFIILSFLIPKELYKNAPREIYVAMFIFLSWLAITSCLGEGSLSGLAAIKKFWLFLAFPIGFYLMRSKKYQDMILLILSFAVLVGGLAGLLQFVTGISWPGVHPPVPSNTWGYRAQGFFSSRMTFAQVFVPLVLMYIFLGLNFLKERVANKRSYFYLASGVIGAIAVILSLSRASMLALIIGLIVTGLILGRRQLLSILAILVLAAALSWQFIPDFSLRIQNTSLIDLRSYKVAGRSFIWEKSFKMASANLWLGVGRTKFQTEYKKLLGADFTDKRIPGDAHNDWLHITATAGLPGLILFLGLWLAILRQSIKNILRSKKEMIIPLAGLIGLLGILVMSSGVSLFEDEEMLQVIVLMWIIAVSKPRTNKAIDYSPGSTAKHI